MTKGILIISTLSYLLLTHTNISDNASNTRAKVQTVPEAVQGQNNERGGVTSQPNQIQPKVEEVDIIPDSPRDQVTSQTGKADLDKLAIAVASHETSLCTAGVGVSLNNCFGIKKGRTAPCPEVAHNNYCKYNHTSESFEAFKVIWGQAYGGRVPTILDAEAWDSKASAQHWLDSVLFFYYQ